MTFRRVRFASGENWDLSARIHDGAPENSWTRARLSIILDGEHRHYDVPREMLEDVGMAMFDMAVEQTPAVASIWMGDAVKPLEEIDRGLPGMVYDEDGNDASISGKPGIYIRRESVGTLPADSYHEYDSFENCTKCGRSFKGLGDPVDDKTFCDGRRRGVIATLECESTGHPSGEHLHALAKDNGDLCHASTAAGESAETMAKYRENYTFIPGVFRKRKL